jgi:hypothetical protein
MAFPKAMDSIIPESDRRVALPEQARVVNVGLPLFAESVHAQGAEVIDVNWRIPAGGHQELITALKFLYGRAARRIDRANAEVSRRMNEGAPMLVDVMPAQDAIPGMETRTVLHPGPSLSWSDFCDPLRRSLRVTVRAEGWASTLEESDQLVKQGRIRLESANDHAVVLPMATTLGPSAPVLVVENPQGGNRAFSGINQGPGKTAWFGVDSSEAIQHVIWLREVAAPLLATVVKSAPPIDIFSLVAQGLQMGDDAHMRTQAATNLLIRHLLPSVTALQDKRRTDLASFLASNHLFFLNLAMAAAKAVTDWSAEVTGSSIVTGMARNGTTFGVRLGGVAGDWFEAPSPMVGNALYYPGFGPESSAPDIGDSAVLELAGLGGAAAAASPAVATFLGGSMADAIGATESMDRICWSRSSRFKLPLLDYRGTPLAIDVRKVVELELTPTINTGILHVDSGLGQVGAGIACAPIECFQHGLLMLAEQYRAH